MNQYVCPECHQAIDVGSVGDLPVACPSCGAAIQRGTVSHQPILPPALPEQSPDTIPNAAESDRRYVRIPRSVLSLQACLLGAVALGGFVLGAGFGGIYSSSNSPGQLPQGPCEIRGRVTSINADGEEVALANAVVIFLPAERRPEQRMEIVGLRPKDDLPPADHPSLSGLRLLGGASARTDDQGRYGLRVHEAGEFFVLVLPRRARKLRDVPWNKPWNKRDLAQIGRYFSDAMGLLENNEYRWQKITVTPGETWDVAFEPQP